MRTADASTCRPSVRTGRRIVAREVALEEAVLAEDLDLQRKMALTALPLRMRDELHVRADRLGVALRRQLSRFIERAEAARARMPQAEAAGRFARKHAGG